VEKSDGYARLQAMLEAQGEDKGVSVVRKTQGLSMGNLLSRIMRLLHSE